MYHNIYENKSVFLEKCSFWLTFIRENSKSFCSLLLPNLEVSRKEQAVIINK